MCPFVVADVLGDGRLRAQGLLDPHGGVLPVRESLQTSGQVRYLVGEGEGDRESLC